MTEEEREVVLDMYTVGFEPESIKYATGLPLRELRSVCREFEEDMMYERAGFLRELQDKGYIKGKEWKWRWKPRKITISLS